MFQTEVRTLVGHVDREIKAVMDRPGADAAPLVVAWAKLVQELALGPEPELRDCPKCGRPGMRAATRCGHCWEALAPLPGPPGH